MARNLGLVFWHAFRILWGVLVAGILQVFDILEWFDWKVPAVWVWLAAAFTVVSSVAVVMWREREAHRRRWVGESLQRRKLDLSNIIGAEPTEEIYDDWEQRAGVTDHSIAAYIEQQLPRRYLDRYLNTDEERPQEVEPYLRNGRHHGWKMKLIHRKRRLESIIEEIGHADEYPELIRRSERRRSERRTRRV